MPYYPDLSFAETSSAIVHKVCFWPVDLLSLLAAICFSMRKQVELAHATAFFANNIHS
jgi:hypothetical protein